MPKPFFVARAFCAQKVAPTPGLDETVELLTRVLGVSEEDPDLTALSAALKSKLGLCHVKKPLYHIAWSRSGDHGREELQRCPQLPHGHLS